MNDNTYRLQCTFSWAALLALLVTSSASSQATFLSSNIDLAYEVQAGGLIARSDVFEPLADEVSFMQGIGDSETASSGASAASADAAFSFTSSLIEASGNTLAEISDMANASSSVDWELSFSIESGIAFYSADAIFGGMSGSLNAGTPRQSLRLVNSRGGELFAIDETTFLPGGDFRASGVLAPDTYTLEANLETHTGSSDEGNIFRLESDFDVSVMLSEPELPLLFGCPGSNFPAIGICLDAIQPTGPFYVITGVVQTSGSADPVPYSLEGVEVIVQTDQQFDSGNGAMPADLAIIEAIFDGDDDNFPEEFFELGSMVRATLAFKSGSLTGDELPEDLPTTAMLGGIVELLDASGNLLATNRLQLIPEPGTITILLPMLCGVAILCRHAR